MRRIAEEMKTLLGEVKPLMLDTDLAALEPSEAAKELKDRVGQTLTYATLGALSHVQALLVLAKAHGDKKIIKKVEKVVALKRELADTLQTLIGDLRWE